MLEASDTPAVAGMTPGQRMAEAIRLHGQWRFDEARKLYESILQEDPGHADANHNLGVLLAVQLLKPQEALPYFEAALNTAPQEPQFWFSYIDGLVKTDALDMAVQVLPLAKAYGLDEARLAQLTREIDLARGSTSALPVAPIPATKAVPARQTKRAAAPAVHRHSDAPPRELQPAVELFNQRDYARGETVARRLSHHYPKSGSVWKLLGAFLQQLGKMDEALQAKRRAVELAPDDAEAHCNLANTLVSCQRWKEADASFQQSIALDPGYVEAYFNYGNALLEQRRLEEAQTALREAAALAPNWADVHSNLGFVLKLLGRPQDAALSYAHALALVPGDAVTLQNLGLVKSELGEDDAALQCFKAAVAASPASADLQGAYGEMLHGMGRLSAAESAFRRALQLQADHPVALRRLGHLLQHQGRLAESETCLRRCMALAPEDARGFYELGTNLIDQKRWGEALEMLRQAIALCPEYPEAHINLSRALYERGDFVQAAREVKASLKVLPNIPALHSNLGVIHTMEGQVDEALENFRHALVLDPNFDFARSCMLYSLSHSVHVELEELMREHLLFGERIAQRVGNRVRTVHGNDRDSKRPLRIGFVSADFRQHAVAKFFIPFIEAFGKRSDLICYAYYNHAARDLDTEAIERHFAVWRPVVGLSDERLAAQIEEDAIDILIDLSGHTAGNRLATFAHKPAPVQVTWGGYPGTTGLDSIDYRLVEHGYMDLHTFRRQFVEQMVELPAVSAFHGLEAMPDVNDAPVLKNGYLTFGSFNRLSKINREVVSVWCRVLREQPGSRLLVAGMSGTGAPADLLEWFAQEGIDAGRLTFHPRTNFYSYLNLHREVDICLDTFPYTGGTTTNHALWMGVPTLTMAGDTYPSRQSAMFLRRVGLERGFVSDSVDGMLAQSQYWAQHVEQLQAMRSRLRGHLLQTHDTHLEVVVAGLAQALRVMWQRWCAGQSAERLRVEYEDIGIKRLPPLMPEE